MNLAANMYIFVCLKMGIKNGAKMGSYGDFVHLVAF